MFSTCPCVKECAIWWVGCSGWSVRTAGDFLKRTKYVRLANKRYVTLSTSDRLPCRMNDYNSGGVYGRGLLFFVHLDQDVVFVVGKKRDPADVSPGCGKCATTTYGFTERENMLFGAHRGHIVRGLQARAGRCEPICQSVRYRVLDPLRCADRANMSGRIQSADHLARPDKTPPEQTSGFSQDWGSLIRRRLLCKPQTSI